MTATISELGKYTVSIREPGCTCKYPKRAWYNNWINPEEDQELHDRDCSLYEPLRSPNPEIIKNQLFGDYRAVLEPPSPITAPK